MYDVKAVQPLGCQDGGHQVSLGPAHYQDSWLSWTLRTAEINHLGWFSQ